MAASFAVEAESSLTDKYQTTVPETVRQVLRLRKRDRIIYVIQDGMVVMRRAVGKAEEEGDDPALGPFLAFLAKDIAANPTALRAIDPALVQRARDLVAGVTFDIDAPLSPDDE